MTIQAPAKVNLTLRILGKRSDGFHNIETLMVPISLADEIEIFLVGGMGVELHCDDPTVPADETNLTWRAVCAFATYTGLTFRVKIKLKKNIPAGAGLGGGSSDAAAILLALNLLLSTNLDVSTLESIASTLGSDVPFFIRNRPALCFGRGDLLENVEQYIPECPILLVKPPFPVPTAWAYKAWDAYRGGIEEQPFQLLGDIALINDLEPPVISKYVLLAALKNWLLKQPEVKSAMMSGAGSTIFVILHEVSEHLIERVQRYFGLYTWTHLCKFQKTI